MLVYPKRVYSYSFCYVSGKQFVWLIVLPRFSVKRPPRLSLQFVMRTVLPTLCLIWLPSVDQSTSPLLPLPGPLLSTFLFLLSQYNIVLCHFFLGHHYRPAKRALYSVYAPLFDYMQTLIKIFVLYHCVLCQFDQIHCCSSTPHAKRVKSQYNVVSEVGSLRVRWNFHQTGVFFGAGHPGSIPILRWNPETRELLSGGGLIDFTGPEPTNWVSSWISVCLLKIWLFPKC